MKLRLLFVPALASALIIAPFAAEPAANPEPAAKAATAAPAVPAEVAALLARHLKALGGEETLRRQMVRSLKGELELAAMPGVTVTFASLAKAPDKLLQAVDVPNVGSVLIGVDGAAGWLSLPGGIVQDIAGDQLKDLVRQADYWWTLEPAKGLTKLAVKGTEKVGTAECAIVEGLTSEKKTERLFFAKETGLLMRWDHEVHTDSGMQAAQDLFEDYREVAGIKAAHLLRRTKPEGATFTFRVTDVGSGGNPDDAKFKRPTQ